MTSPRDVLRMQVDLRDRLENPVGYLARGVKFYAQHQYDDTRVDSSLPGLLYRHVLNARAYHVEPDMVDLLIRRAEDPDHFTGTETFEQFFPPFAMGFLVFGKPLETIEVQTRIQKAVALTWGPAQAHYSSGSPSVSGRFVVFWSNSFQAPDDVHEDGLRGSDGFGDGRAYAESMRLVGGWAPTILDFIPFDARLGPIRIGVPEERAKRAEAEGHEWAREGTTNYARVLAALWELMSETLSTARTEKLDRATHRFARRAKIGTDITVIELRRQAREALRPGSGTPLQWRVPVSGHPRTYHRGRPEEFTIWIKDHERGPRDAPLRVTRKVYDLKR